MHLSVQAFCARVITAEDVAGQHVIEAGSLNVNGSVREHVMTLGPASYTGIDLREGPGVDVVMDAADLARTARTCWCRRRRWSTRSTGSPPCAA